MDRMDGKSSVSFSAGCSLRERLVLGIHSRAQFTASDEAHAPHLQSSLAHVSVPDRLQSADNLYLSLKVAASTDLSQLKFALRIRDEDVPLVFDTLDGSGRNSNDLLRRFAWPPMR